MSERFYYLGRAATMRHAYRLGWLTKADLMRHHLFFMQGARAFAWQHRLP